MKSNEEFEKSVFAKRDALLKKRKNAIVTVASLACTALCISLAAYAVKPMKTAAPDTASDTTASTSPDVELYTFESNYPMTEIYREQVEDEMTISSKTEEKSGETITSADAQKSESAENGNFTESKTEIAPEGFVPVTEPAILIVTKPSFGSSGNFDYTSSEPFDPNKLTGDAPATSQKNESTTKKYPTDKEVTAAAMSYLTESEKASLTDEAPMITITHHTDPEKADEFHVYFKLLNGKTKVILNADTLELIEKK